MDVSAIDGVIVTPEKQISHPKGDLFHVMKQSSDGFVGFGETYLSTVGHDVIKGWKCHQRVTLNLVVPMGRIRFVVCERTESAGGGGRFFEIEIGGENHVRLTVKPGLWVAFQGRTSGTNMLLNVIDEEHDPTEAENLDLAEIPYEW